MFDRELHRKCFDFLWERRELPIIPEFHQNHPARHAFHADLARLAGHSVGKVHGGWAIVKVWTGEMPSARQGDWDGIGNYTENIQHCLRHLLPISGTYLSLERDGAGRSMVWLDNGKPGIGPSPARAFLMAWLPWLAATHGAADT